jgi:peroxiredoxin
MLWLPSLKKSHVKENNMIKVGDQLPEFKLKDQDNNEFDCKELKGKKVLLSFHPLAFTPVCADQMKSLEDNKETFSQLNTVPLGFSIDHPFCKGAWAKELGITETKLLADFWPHGGYAHSLGLFIDKLGFTKRANVIADEEGKVIFVKEYDIPQLPDINEIIDFLKK